MVVVCAVGIFAAYRVVRGLATGVISYGGNAPNTPSGRGYSRSKQPGMYWTGVAILTGAFLLMAAVMCLAVYIVADAQ